MIQGSLGGVNTNPKINQYYQILAAPTPRKLALLVGINEYGEGLNLKGCLTDVERQRELLIYRFGFQPQDIITLTGKQATREGIETAFVEHLIKQAEPGDVVVFHFSGYGNLIKIDPEFAPSVSEGMIRGFVPSDSLIKNKPLSTTNDLLEDTLMLLGQSLATEKLTMVLDTSHYSIGQTLQGDLRIRSFASISEQPNPEELEFQTQLKNQLKQITFNSKQSFIPGIILSAAGNQQVASEMRGNGFSAGLFTYALTQYLWQITSPSRVEVTLNKTAEQLVPWVGTQQQPQQNKGNKQPLFTYYLLPSTPQGAEGVIISVEDQNNLTLKLTGIPANILSQYGLNSCFQTVTTSSTPNPLILQLRSRDGLKAKVRRLRATDTQPLIVGQLVQEVIRCLPKTVGLIIALDSRLERIERVDATSAFASISAVSSVLSTGEQAADCVLGFNPLRLPAPSKEPNDTQNLGGYGIFSPGGSPWPNTIGKSGEAIKSAVERLHPTLDKLLALKLWGLTVNEGSSVLPCSVTLETLEPTSHPLSQRQTTRLDFLQEQPPIEGKTTDISVPNSGLIQVSRGSRLQYRLENKSQQSIYYLIVGINSNGEAIAYVPPKTELESENIGIIASRTTFIVPYPDIGLNWTVAATPGWEQNFVILSQAPFEKTLKVLQESPAFQANKGPILILDNPRQVAESVLKDLNNASAIGSEIIGSAIDSYVLDVKVWATLSFVYQVV
ncbi:peptidase [Aphanothece sacrum FPU3]|nr:peptidase [Aphanothece sacrum FPU3]